MTAQDFAHHGRISLYRMACTRSKARRTRWGAAGVCPTLWDKWVCLPIAGRSNRIGAESWLELISDNVSHEDVQQNICFSGSDSNLSAVFTLCPVCPVCNVHFAVSPVCSVHFAVPSAMTRRRPKWAVAAASRALQIAWRGIWPCPCPAYHVEASNVTSSQYPVLNKL